MRRQTERPARGAAASPAPAWPAGPPTMQGRSPAAPPARRPPLPLAIILAAYLLLGIWYSVATPILEVSDENTQEAVIGTVAAGRGLPVMLPADARHLLVPAQEAGQPPLAYMLAAAATAWTHAPAPVDVMVINPLANIGSPDYNPRNRNLFAHSAAEAFPWRGLALAVHLQRLLSLLYGAVVVAGVYRLGRLAAPRDSAVATAAAALCAFDPMFLFIAASADNDALAAAVSTSVLVLLATALNGDLTWRRSAMVGILCGLAALSKLNAAAVALLVIGVYLAVAASRRRRITALKQLALAGSLACLVSGWWFWRNGLLYHDPLALHTFVGITGPRSHLLGVADVLREMPAVWYSFWGVFGNFNILLPAAYYRIDAILATLAGLGLLLALVSWLRSKRTVNAVLTLLAVWLGVEALALMAWTSVTSGSTGRLLLPAIGSITVLLALGLHTLGRRLAPALPLAPPLALGAAIAATAAVPLAILPAYRAPRFVPVGQLQPARRLDVRFGNLVLAGVSTSPGPVAPGQVVTVTLYWRTSGPVAGNDAEALVLRGPDGVVLQAVDTLPGNTEVATSQWPPHRGLVDSIPIPVPRGSPVPELGLLSLVVYPAGEPARPIEPTDAHGGPVSTTVLARLELRDSGVNAAAATPATTLGVFGGAMALVGASAPTDVAAGSTLAVHVRWQALGSPAINARELLRLVDARGTTVARLARLPHRGGLPTTDWLGGEQVNDMLPLPVSPDVPPGSYRLTLELRDARGIAAPLPGGRAALTVAQVVVTRPPPPPPLSVGYRFGNLELEGVRMPKGPVAPGSSLPVTLTWRAGGPIASDDVVSLQLRGPDGYLVAQHDARPLGGALLTSEWPMDWIAVDQVTLALAADSPAPALAHLIVQVYPAGQPNRPLAPRTAGGEALGTARVGSVTLRRIGSSVALPPLPAAFQATFGHQVELVGAALPETGLVGSTVAVTLRWQALRPPQADDTVFLHATDAAGHLAFQVDSRPHGGRLPTTDWATGEVVDDAMQLTIPPQTPPGEYALSAGLYDLATLQRLTLPDGRTELGLGILNVVQHG
jgi:hypothetical protein